jgi:two-component system response regulator (stage 0 sporulation protein F)
MAAPLILVVDDQVGVRRLIQEVFKGVGYRVAMAENGEEAISLAAQEEPDLVLLDMKMPVMDGLQTLHSLKRQHHKLAVFMMTALGDTDQISQAMAGGARSCISKPFDVFALQTLVDQTLGEVKRT